MKLSKKIALFTIQLFVIGYCIHAQSIELERLYNDQFSLLKVKDCGTNNEAEKTINITMSKGYSYAVVLQPAESEDIPVILLTKNELGSSLTQDDTEQHVVSSNYQEGKRHPTIYFECDRTGIYQIDLSEFKGKVYTLRKKIHTERIG